MLLRRVVSIRYRTGSSPILGRPLVRTGRTLHQVPLIAEQGVQVPVVPLHRVAGPCAFQPAADRVDTFAAAIGVFPAEALFLDAGALGLGADVRARIGSAMAFAERMAAGNERDCLLVIHRHASERLSD